MRLHTPPWDEESYTDPFDFFLTEREGQLLARSDAQLPMSISQTVTFKVSTIFYERLHKVCSGPSISLIFAWMLNEAINDLIRKDLCLVISQGHTIALNRRSSYYVCDCRATQVPDYRYINVSMPRVVLKRARAHMIGKSGAVSTEKLVSYKMDSLQEENKTGVVFLA